MKSRLWLLLIFQAVFFVEIAVTVDEDRSNNLNGDQNTSSALTSSREVDSPESNFQSPSWNDERAGGRVSSIDVPEGDPDVVLEGSGEDDEDLYQSHYRVGLERQGHSLVDYDNFDKYDTRSNVQYKHDSQTGRTSLNQKSKNSAHSKSKLNGRVKFKGGAKKFNHNSNKKKANMIEYHSKLKKLKEYSEDPLHKVILFHKHHFRKVVKLPPWRESRVEQPTPLTTVATTTDQVTTDSSVSRIQEILRYYSGNRPFPDFGSDGDDDHEIDFRLWEIMDKSGHSNRLFGRQYFQAKVSTPRSVDHSSTPTSLTTPTPVHPHSPPPTTSRHFAYHRVTEKTNHQEAFIAVSVVDLPNRSKYNVTQNASLPHINQTQTADRKQNNTSDQIRFNDTKSQTYLQPWRRVRHHHGLQSRLDALKSRLLHQSRRQAISHFQKMTRSTRTSQQRETENV